MLNATVVIDPGHGGTVEVNGSSWNNAISASGVLEKVITLQFGLLVRDALLERNNADLKLTVVMTRQTDVNLGLTERANVARTHKAARFLSIHCNGFNKQSRGVETLIRSAADGNVNAEQDRAFAQRVQKAVFETILKFDKATKDRGVKEQRVGVLNDAALGNTPQSKPCRACLVEIEFIDVEAVDKLLVTNTNAHEVRAAIASAMAQAIVDDIRAG